MDDNTMVLRLVGKRVKEIRKALSLSQEELGEKAGFHFTYIGSVERGEANITLKNLARISSTLGVSIAELFKYQESLDQIYEQNQSPLIRELFELLAGQDEVQLNKIKNVISEILT